MNSSENKKITIPQYDNATIHMEFLKMDGRIKILEDRIELLTSHVTKIPQLIVEQLLKPKQMSSTSGGKKKSKSSKRKVPKRKY